MIYFKNGEWQVHTHVATFIDSSSGEEVGVVEYTSDREELEKRISKWAHFYRLAIENVEIDPMQEQRLVEMNALGLDESYVTEVDNYVRYGYISTGTYDNVDFQTLSEDPNVKARYREYQIAKMSEKIALKRWTLEVAGVSISGMGFGTSDREKTLINGKVTSAMINPQPSYRFKVYEGWVTLTTDQIKRVGVLIDEYVQECFNHEDWLMFEVRSAPEPSSVNIDEGWPSRELVL